MKGALLSAHDVDVAYGERAVLHHVSLDVAHEELLVVVGPNGAGKTTLLRALAGTLLPARGDVAIEGRSLSSMRRDEIARRIAVVPQDLPEVEGFTVREVVAMGRAPHQGRWLRASREDDALVDRVLERCAAHALAGRSFSSLSGGERKRVTIAQALCQAPAVLLLDEPSAFLDLGHAIDLFELVRAEARAGLAVVATVHDLSLAARFADRALLLVDGRIAAIGSPDDVLSPPRLGAAFGVSLRKVVDPESGVAALVVVGRA